MNKIYVIVEGGCVTDVWSTADADVEIIDLDDKREDPDDPDGECLAALLAEVQSTTQVF